MPWVGNIIISEVDALLDFHPVERFKKGSNTPMLLYGQDNVG